MPFLVNSSVVFKWNFELLVFGFEVVVVVVVVVITPPLPRDGGTARTAIQVHAVNLIEIKLGERW